MIRSHKKPLGRIPLPRRISADYCGDSIILDCDLYGILEVPWRRGDWGPVAFANHIFQMSRPSLLEASKPRFVVEQPQPTGEYEQWLACRKPKAQVRPPGTREPLGQQEQKSPFLIEAPSGEYEKWLTRHKKASRPPITPVAASP